MAGFWLSKAPVFSYLCLSCQLTVKLFFFIHSSINLSSSFPNSHVKKWLWRVTCSSEWKLLCYSVYMTSISIKWMSRICRSKILIKMCETAICYKQLTRKHILKRLNLWWKILGDNLKYGKSYIKKIDFSEEYICICAYSHAQQYK